MDKVQSVGVAKWSTMFYNFSSGNLRDMHMKLVECLCFSSLPYLSLAIFYSSICILLSSVTVIKINYFFLHGKFNLIFIYLYIKVFVHTF
jgi:hypothetical protein